MTQKPPGVQNSSVVDVVMESPSGEFILIMVESRPWDGSPERLVELQDKVNTYLAFALDGELVAKYPDARGRSVLFQLDCFEQPDDYTDEFLGRVSAELARHGVRFSVNVLPRYLS